MSTIASPLTDLLKQDTEWYWSSECEEAFFKIKDILTSEEGVLVHYDPNKPVTLAVDASPRGLGAVISHVTEQGERPIAYGSRTLTQAERNYSQIEREGLAIIFGLQKFHQYLFGRKFTIITDNKPLSYIFSPNKGIPVLAAARIQRWAMQLASYSYDISVRSSSQNGNADALSRLPQTNTEDRRWVKANWTSDACAINVTQVNGLPVSAKNIATETIHDPILSKVMFFTINGWPEADDMDMELQAYYRKRHEMTVEEGCLLWGIWTIIPGKYREIMLRELHESHPGMIRMKSLARQHVWWPLIDEAIEKMVKSCPVCQDLQPKPTKLVGNAWKWPSKPWSRVHLDFAGPFMGENFFIMVDAHSKWPEVHHMKSTTATRTIEVIRQTFAQHGLPTEVVTDNGPQFVSEEFEQFMKVNGVKHIRAPAYHPSTNGEAERFVQTFKKAMKSSKSKYSWNRRICTFLLHYRTTPHTVTGVTPAELMGKKLRTRLDAVHPNITGKMERKCSNNISRERYLETGDSVLVRDYRQRKDTWTRGIVQQKLGPYTYIVQVKDLVWKRHIDQMKLVEHPGDIKEDLCQKPVHTDFEVTNDGHYEYHTQEFGRKRGTKD